jgi:hypothetical protein
MQTKITIHVEPGTDFGNATDVAIYHDVGDPGLLCSAMVRIQNNSQPCEIAQALEQLAQAVRQFDAVRDDARRKHVDVVTTMLSDLELAEQVHAKAAESGILGTAPGPWVQTMPPHQQRMLAEHKELGERITKLKAFMQGDLFHRQSAYEQSDMVSQLDGMVAYHQALGRRIERFKKGDGA